MIADFLTIKRTELDNVRSRPAQGARAMNGSSDSTVLKGEAAPRASTRPETRITSSEKTAPLY
jgi:hypothetical protein